MRKSDVYFKAAEIIEERGHTKYELESKDGRVCLLGAIYAATTGNPLAYDEIRAEVFCPSIHKTVFNYSTHPSVAIGAMVDWNNDPERTPTDVIDALKHTGKMVRELEETGL